MNKTNNYSELYDYFEQLTDESKIHFSNTIFKNSLEEINEVLENNLFGSINDFFDYDDSFDDSDSKMSGEELPMEMEKIMSLKRKDDSMGNPPIYVVMEMDDNLMHIYSDDLKEINKFTYENLFLKGMFFKELKDKERDDTIDYKNYRCMYILGQLEQDVCYN